MTTEKNGFIMKKKQKIILCERCKENEAVCIWDLHGEYYGCNVCEKCCSKLTEERHQICSGKSLRTKADPFVDIKYTSLLLLYAFVAALAWAFRDPHINYLKIFELDNFLSFFCMTSFGHFSALLLSYNKKRLHSVFIIGLEIICGIFGACAVFNNRFKYDFFGITIIICLSITFVVAITLLIIHKRRINKCMPTWLRLALIMMGFISALVATFLISIKDMMELNMFGL